MADTAVAFFHVLSPGQRADLLLQAIELHYKVSVRPAGLGGEAPTYSFVVRGHSAEEARRDVGAYLTGIDQDWRDVIHLMFPWAAAVEPARDRDRSAEDRDRRADVRDQVAEARDSRADDRDERAEARERAADGGDREAAADRGGARRDRMGGASDRTDAADDRTAASSDRFLSAEERAAFSVDALTGAHRRDVGLVELEREMDRAKRTKHPFALAFVDVDGLKARNDSLGHTAGDRLLRSAVDSIRANLRSYDLIVRFGGDEFLCGVTDVTAAEAGKRFARVNAELAASQQASITVGLAELEADDALEDLVERADQALYRERQKRRSI